MPLTKSKQPQSVRSGFKFFELPFELRVRIYGFVYKGLMLTQTSLVVKGQQPRELRWVKKPQLEFVSKQVRGECLPVRRRNITLHIRDMALYKNKPNQPADGAVATAKAATSALPRSITSTLTELNLYIDKSLVSQQEFDTVFLPSLKIITFDLCIPWSRNVNFDDPGHLLGNALWYTRGLSPQPWPPRGLPEIGVKYYVCCRVYDSDALLTVRHSSTIL